MRSLGIFSSGYYGAFDPSSFGMTFQNIWWADDPFLGYNDADNVTTVAPYVGADTLTEAGAGATTFRSTSASMNNRSVFEMGSTSRLYVAPTVGVCHGGVIVFRQRTVISQAGLVSSGSNTRIKNNGITGYQMRYNGGTTLSSPIDPDTSTHIIAWYFDDSGNEIMNLDGVEVINGASADSGSGMLNFQLNYDNSVYGNSDYGLVCSTTGDPTADPNWASFLAATKTYYGIP